MDHRRQTLFLIKLCRGRDKRDLPPKISLAGCLLGTSKDSTTWKIPTCPEETWLGSNCWATVRGQNMIVTEPLPKKLTFPFLILFSIMMDVINDIALERIMSAMTGSQNLGSSDNRRENTVNTGCSCGTPCTSRLLKSQTGPGSSENRSSRKDIMAMTAEMHVRTGKSFVLRCVPVV